MADKFEKLNEDIVELKVTIAKQESNLDNMNKILDRLTESVEIHVKRSDNLELLIHEVRNEMKQDLHSEIKPIKSHIHFVKGAIWALGIFGTILGALYSAGILQKLF